MLDYDATNVELSGPNVQFTELDWDPKYCPPPFEEFEAGWRQEVFPKPRLIAQSKKFLRQISWSDTSGDEHHESDDDERQALRAEGLNPDDPAVIAAIDLVRWELSLGT